MIVLQILSTHQLVTTPVASRNPMDGETGEEEEINRKGYNEERYGIDELEEASWVP